MNNMPFVIPNFMPFDNNLNNFNNNDDIKKELDKISHDLESIEKRLISLENKLDFKSDNYYTTDVKEDKGLYMI